MDDLPPGWVAREDPRYNRMYYFNKKTKESTWIKPTFEDPVDKPREKRRQWSMANGPSGDQFTTDQGVWIRIYSNNHSKYYFYNKTTGKTTWKDPRTYLNNSINGPDKKNQEQNNSVVRNNSIQKSPLKKAQSQEFSSDDDETLNTSGSERVKTEFDDDPEVFQARIMEQFPALKKAFQELEEGQRKLQQDRQEHEARVKRELDLVNAKLEELRKATEKFEHQVSGDSQPKTNSYNQEQLETSNSAYSIDANKPRERADTARIFPCCFPSSFVVKIIL